MNIQVYFLQILQNLSGERICAFGGGAALSEPVLEALPWDQDDAIDPNMRKLAVVHPLSECALTHSQRLRCLSGSEGEAVD